jgi:transglutaminase-like putative cysteine protease
MSILSFTRKKNKVLQAEFKLCSHNAWLLWCCQCLNVALISLELSTWMLALISLLFMWQALLINKKNKDNTLAIQPVNKESNQTKEKANHHISPIVLGVFAIAGCIAISLSAQGLGVLLSMLHLLAFAYALKAFELKKRSDFYQLFLLGLFILGSALIFRQNLSFSIITALVLIVNFAVLMQFFSFKQPVQKNLKTVTLLLVQSMLLAAVLFVVFPRLSPLWQVPRGNSATTGLSDTVKPGDIAKLAQSGELAFRANFTEGDIPSYSQLYWRAMVLENYDGRQWSRIKTNSNSPDKNNREIGFNAKELASSKELTSNTEGSDKLTVEKLSYQVITEPSFQHWLFSLAPAISLDKSVMMLPDFTVRSRHVINQRKAYHLESYLNQALELDLPNNTKALNLLLPAESNPRLMKLARQLKQQYPNSEQRALAVLSHIRNEQYFYTLEPPLLINNSLDQFYFDTKAGFCVHYASAFTFIMRASGIPARVVTGYLGGEYNGISDLATEGQGSSERKGHVSVYQSDAHAWSEIWVKDKGWLRIDPTGAVDPERVNSGRSELLQQQQSALNNDLISGYRLKQFAWINSLRLQFDSLDYQWTRLVLGYSTSKQYDLLQQLLGQVKPWKIALIITSAVGLSASFLFIWFFWKGYKKKSRELKTPWLIIYQQSLSLLAKKGLTKMPSMTAQCFLYEIKEKCPEISMAFARVHASFSRLSYQALSMDEHKVEFKKLQQYYKALQQEIKKI